MLVADIIIEQTAFSFDKPYGYAIPQDLAETLKPGCRVVVPFGKGNTHRQGMVIGIYADETNPPYKEIIRTIDSEPIITEEMIELCKWMHEHCFCTYFEAVKAVLPIGVSFKVQEIFTKGQTPFDTEYSFLEEYFSVNEFATRDALITAYPDAL